MTYVITERITAGHPESTDPKAQAFKRHSGVFDLRDGDNNNTITITNMNLKALRQMQARWNTSRVLDAII
jgi:hypothetical protein